MSKAVRHACIAIALALTALWGGTWLFHWVGEHYRFAALFTAMGVLVAAGIFAGSATHESTEGER